MTRSIRWVEVCILLVFIVLSLLHFFSDRPLWEDEIYVKNNLEKYHYVQLFGVLDHSQSFPRVYLVWIKFLSRFFDYHMKALRFLPLVMMICALGLWRRVYQRQTDHAFIILSALLLFACSFRMVYYAAELKPYSLDVLSVALVALICFKQKGRDADQLRPRDYLSSAVLPFFILFSYGSIFVVWIPAWNYLLKTREDKRFWKIFILSAGSCVLAAMLFYLIDFRYSVNDANIHYWNDYFLCVENRECFLSTFGEGVQRLVTYWFGNTKPQMLAASLFIPVFMFGMVRYGGASLLKDRLSVTNLDAMAIVLFFEMMVLGVLRKYPFTGERLTLFYAPIVFYLTVKTIWSTKKMCWIFWPLTAYCVGYAVYCAGNTLKVVLSYFA
ncbi:MAG: hypothetical protein K8S27_02610 [Candidatus Omnitrophica bacterium]|nr:hypothetical protein [Candidatus Omnitrophota bacterium]